MALPYPKKFPPELRDAAIALTRFGYGARPGEVEAISGDPRGWLLAQLDDSAVPTDFFQGLPGGTEIAAQLLRASTAGEEVLRDYRQRASESFQTEATVHTAYALATGAPFRERLVRFWCNHFSLSVLNPRIFPLTHAFEREVVRPGLGGSFVQMLTAAMHHPAMLLNYGAERSIGPWSRAGLKGAAGMTDALARAVMGRYTFGEDHKPSGKDILNLTKMFTGWSIAGPEEANPGGFLFRETWHEPNSKYFLLRNYPHAGVLEAEATLDTLGRREETARNLAFKMARHFVADTPPPELISDMLRGFTNGGNSLTGMAKGMVMSQASWNPQQMKVKTPEDMVFSAARAMGLGGEAGRSALRSLAVLGQAAKHAPAPSGWSDISAAWLSPQQMLERLDWGAAAARQGMQPGMRDRPASDTALAVLGPLLSPVTFRRIVVAADRGEGLAMFFASPEFQRR